MPKEQARKRGKRKAKVQEEGNDQPTSHVIEPEPSTSAGIHPARAAMLAGRPIPVEPVPEAQEWNEDMGGLQEEGQADWTRGPRTESEFPFGVLDPDVKAYFKNIEEQIKDWEGVSSEGEEREDRQIFLSSILSELRGHELSASTDPETSIVLERLLPSLSDWGRRVIGDSFGDKWEQLLKHRFGSHVVQTWMTLAADTLDREARDIWPPQQAKQDPKVGQLPTMTSLFSLLLSNLLPCLPQLISSPHASPPIRLLMLVLTPKRTLPALGEGRDDTGLIRSKRSGKWRKGQGVKGKSILGEDESINNSKASKRKLPSQLENSRREIRNILMKNIDKEEWKAMGVDAVGSAIVQLLLEFEVNENDAEREESLFDIITEGLVSKLASRNENKLEAKPYVSSLLSFQTGTRLFESLLHLAPSSTFIALWETYFEGKLGKLAGHPYANFVVAKGVARLDKEKVVKLIEEVKGNSGGRGLIKAARTSVIQALVDRSLIIKEFQSDVLQLISSCLELPAHLTSVLVPCLMTLRTYPIYRLLLTGAPLPTEDPLLESSDNIDVTAEAETAAAARLAAWQNRRQVKHKDDLTPNIQGCLILQGMVGMENINEAVLDSLTSLPTETLLAYAKSPIASRFLDRVFIESTVPLKYRKKLMLVFMKSYKELVQDKLGSRVVDTIWEKADGYMKEKIARSLVPYVTELGGSQYGKYFLRRADIVLLDRRPEEWREKILSVKHHFAHQKTASIAPPSKPTAILKEQNQVENDMKRKKEKRDEIDELFEGVEKKRKIKA
ncbi:uncharacterized protein L203_100525 [Cryptococcus depauperatus CBS 7841]|uniref:Nucleolar protein 9 n=1 Tax=Cryptococcus depauperatus CBS 7841 TaxID=1295531 RepID=A0AAJ8LXD3_9TREE